MIDPQILIALSVILFISLILMIILNQRVKKKNTENENALNEAILKIEELSAINDNQNTSLTEMSTRFKDVLDIDELITIRMNEVSSADEKLNALNEKYLTGLEIYNKLDQQISLYNNEIDIMDFGLYKPQFDFTTSEVFKDKIEQNYLQQKSMISNDLAAICHTEWTVNGNKAEGRKMTKLNKKNMLYAFNGECDALIAKVKWNNATKSIERLEKAYQSINKLGEVNNITISYDFYKLKREELALVHEFENKKQDEKEEQRRIREQMREEEKVQKDIERAQREAEEDERRYQKALKRVQEDLKYAGKDEIEELNHKLIELQEKLQEAEAKKARALSMAQLTKAGHIYIISNIGSFGEDVYKIGMTRRLEPLDRVRELSDAAVPFRYDVHAVIYSDDAPKLEHELHKKFDDRRINRVNGRKEFFKVSLDEIAEFVKDHNGAEIEFTQIAEAREYRETMLIMNALLKSAQESELLETKESEFPSTLI